MPQLTLDFFLAALVVILFAIGIHEYAHAKVADMSGDPTPRDQGRVTLNLFNHFDPIGSLMILLTIITGFGIGWGRPVPMDPRKMNNPRWDHFAAVLAGPLSNLVQAGVWALAFRFVAATTGGVIENQFLFWLLTLGVLTNLSLCFFNMIPLGPLDGHWLLGTFLPEKARFHWYQWNRTVGGFVLLAVVLGSQLMSGPGRPGLLYYVIGVPAQNLFQVFTGTQF